MTKIRFLYVLGFLFLALVAPLAYQLDRAAQSLPKLDGEARLPGLSAPAEVVFDRFGIPTITAADRADAYRALGFLHARDRLFQMDLMRRKSAGRLAEIFGTKALETDREQRPLQLQQAAAAIAAALPADQRRTAEAYAAGVNAHIQTASEFPPEFRLLKYRPEPWRVEDSLLVALSMFQTLGLEQAEAERMLTIMENTLPAEVVAFLTPDTDDYTQPMVGGRESRRPPRPIPAAALARLIAASHPDGVGLAAVDPHPPSVGSNNWAVSGRKTADGRAMIADDMHLPLGLPNIWYRAHLLYGGKPLGGITLPGVPLVVAGSNGRVAWGFTNVDGDFLDLVSLDTDAARPDRYRTPGGWREMEIWTETLTVKDGESVKIQQRRTLWGPVAPEPLLGRSVALRWTALDPAAVNLGLQELDRANTLEQAMNIVNRTGAPPQNVVMADEGGRIGWTFMGAFPARRGFDGSTSRSFADGRIGWTGYVPPDELPRIADPPEGYLASANDRLVGKAYPHVIGHSFSSGYRAHRIREQLRVRSRITESDMLALQLDTTSGFYEFYRELALKLLTADRTAREPELVEIASEIRAWNGRLDPESRGIGLLVQWRKDLAKAVFGSILSSCTTASPNFVYRWHQLETPLRALLRERLPETLPVQQEPDWNTFLLSQLRRSGMALQQQHQVRHLADLPWGKVNTVRIQHPFSRAVPALSALLDPPALAGACNNFCLKVLHDLHGASERLVVSPGHPEDGILHMPGGQSGHPLSPHYRDQQEYWSAGTPIPFQPGHPLHRLRLISP